MRRRVLFGSMAATALSTGMVRAQQKAMPVIGYLSVGAPGPSAPFVDAFREGLSEAGYVEGKTVAIEYRWSEDRYDQLPALAADLVSRKVDLVVTGGGTATGRAAKNASSTIPIVFIGGDDPVAAGLVASLARPGGNLTGVSVLSVQLNPKRLELLHELVPRAGVIGVLLNPNSPTNERVTLDLQNAARVTGVQLLIQKARSEREIAASFDYFVQRQASALIVSADTFFNSQRDQLIELAARYSIPSIYAIREFATAGGLISYGASRTAIAHQAGIYAGKVLDGVKPANLPVMQPTVFELVVNLKTAKALGITVPPSILARADEVIE